MKARKIFLDTNVWLRFIVADNQKQYLASKNLITAIEAGKFKPYISNIVLLEIYYVLRSFYRVSKAKAINVLEKILQTREIVLLKKADMVQAIGWHQKYNLKLSDSLILTSLPKEVIFISWDKEFRKIPFLKAVTPEKIQ